MAERPGRGSPAPPLTLCLSGEFRVLRHGVAVPAAIIGSRKARQVLKLLAVASPGHLSAERIAAELWPDDPPADPVANVATLVSRLRAALGATVIDRDRAGYRLGPGARVDLAMAAAHLAEAQRRNAEGASGLSLAAVGAALEAVADPVAVADEPDAAWAEPARVELARLRITAHRLGAAIAAGTGDHEAVLEHADAVVAEDRFDEDAYRLAMRADAASGRTGRALRRYEDLKAHLADELGVDPSDQTRELHLAILRNEATGPVRPEPERAVPRTESETVAAAGRLVGRDPELARLDQIWADVAAGHPALVLLNGEAGIGKTRLAAELTDHAERTGGVLLTARCYETERSLFLQPIVEALGRHAGRIAPDRIRALAGDGAAELALLLPDLAAALGAPVPERLNPEIALARVYRAVSGYLIRMATAPPRPVLLFLDDLQQAGLATLELLHHLIRVAGAAPLMVVATVRAEDGATVRTALGDIADVIEVGPLPEPAVETLARDVGHGDLAASIVARTGGHAFFVVETLAALAAGEDGVPASLTAAVLARVDRAGLADLLRGAAVLGSAIEPDLLARLLDAAPTATAERCESALQARLLVVSGRAYDFAHDLVREVVYQSIPEPTRLAYHRRAADLLEARPEALAPHAAAIGDTARAARAWLFAGEEAYLRLATADAEPLLTNALAAADTTGDLEVAGRAWLTRGRVREQIADFAGAIDDYGRSVSVARQTGDRRLEMLARQARGGDPKVALGQSVEDAAGDLAAALRLAAALGDREVEVALLARLGIVECNRLDFRAGLDYGLRAVRAARSSGEAPAVAAALDGLKTAYAYMGQIGPLETVLDELMPLLREQRDVARMQWAVHESGFIPLARGDWAEATELFEDALRINRRSGYGSYECWFLGFIAWARRLAGELGAAVDAGRRAVAASRDSSVWFRAASRAQLGAALLAVDHVDEASAVLLDGRDLATQAGSESYLLRCLGPLTEATARRHPGSDQAVSLATEFERRLSGIDVPDGAAWILGADCYFAAARGWRLLDRPDRAAALLAPLQAAAKTAGWSWIADSR